MYIGVETGYKFIARSEFKTVVQYLKELGYELKSDQGGSGMHLLVETESSSDVTLPSGSDKFLKEVKQGNSELKFSTHRLPVRSLEDAEDYLLDIPNVTTCDHRTKLENTCRVRIQDVETGNCLPNITYPNSPIKEIVSYACQHLPYQSILVEGDLITIQFNLNS